MAEEVAEVETVEPVESTTPVEPVKPVEPVAPVALYLNREIHVNQPDGSSKAYPAGTVTDEIPVSALRWLIGVGHAVLPENAPEPEPVVAEPTAPVAPVIPVAEPTEEVAT